MHFEMVCPRQVEFELVRLFDQLDGLLGMHGLHCLFSLVLENCCSRVFFEVIQLCLDNKIADYSVCGGKFLLTAVGNMSVSNYSRTVGLQIVSLGMHCLHFFFLSWQNSCSRQLEF